MTEDTETDDPEQNVAEDRDGSVERRRRPDPVAEALGDDELITSPEPVTAAYSKTEDLYDVSTWEVRSRLDRLSVKIYDTLTDDPRRTLIALVTVLLALQVAVLLYILLFVPEFGFFALLSIIPAGLITAYIWYRFSTPRKRLKPILATFILSMVLTGGAALSNEAFNALSFLVPFVGGTLFFFLVVAPGEEIVKLLAVRLYAYRSDDFRQVIDGAIFGAVAGLGFATAENLGYIISNFGEQGAGIVFIRALAGPGHVVYSAFAGYYLGLARFDPDNAGPIIVKGLLIAVLLHGTYNSMLGILGSIGGLGLIIPFIVIFLGGALLLLRRKLVRYRKFDRRLRASTAGEPARHGPVDGQASVNFDFSDQFEELQSLHDKGFLSDEEFEQKRQELLDRI